MNSRIVGMKKTSRVKVSVFIPCYNMGKYIEDAIQSVYSQTYRDYEIIVVDDGSTDEQTLGLLERIGKEHPDIRMFYKDNSGLSGAKNYGITRAVGEYIVCLDADDKLEPTYLEKTVGLMDFRKDDNIAFVTTWVQEFGLRSNTWKTSGYDIPKLLITNTVHAGSIFRKDVWEKVGGFKKVGASYEDWEFWMNIVENGYKWDIIEEPLFYYRIRKNSLLSSAQSSHLEIYGTNFDLHKKLYDRQIREFAIENARQIKELRYMVSEKEKAIAELEKYKDEVVLLREKVHTLKDDIHSLRNARLLGKIIKCREAIGSVRQRLNLLPRRGMHKVRVGIHRVRVVGAPLIHPVIRKKIKGIYKDLREALNKDKIRVVNQEEWPTKLPLVSIVVPYYNAGKTIDETLDSLKNQTLQSTEIIVVNDGSTDQDSINKFNDLTIHNPKINFINQKNQGPAAARNTGVSKAKGKYIVCLDSDDWVEPTYIEKTVLILETNPDIALVSPFTETFGIKKRRIEYLPYDPILLFSNNILIHAAAFRREAWEASGGYKSGIGYEDWEYWITLAEKGYWGKTLEEPLFHYRVSADSRYVSDKDAHWRNLKKIKSLHPKYKKTIKKIRLQRKNKKTVVEPSMALINIDKKKQYLSNTTDKEKILITIPWMTFGGAETLIYNYCREINKDFDITFVTGLKSKNEWEHKFREITPKIYHLANMFEDKQLQLEFICNYIKTREIEVLHIIHNGFTFELIPEIKKRNPNIKIVVTMFNDRVEYFGLSLEYEKYVDIFVTDNDKVAQNYKSKVSASKPVRVIPNGINCYQEFSKKLYDYVACRKELGIKDDGVGVFFIGRLSEEKNPDVFVDAAKLVISSSQKNDTKFFIIGDGNMKEEVERRISDASSKEIKYLGYQPSLEVARYLSGGDIFVLPSRVEGFPLSILEAMAMETAVIASDVGAVSQVISNGKDGFVVTPGSAKEISETVIKLVKDRPLLETIKKRARSKVENKYSNKVLGDNYRKLYKELMK